MSIYSITLVEKEKLIILEKEGISEGVKFLKSTTEVEELNFGRKGFFLRNRIEKKSFERCLWIQTEKLERV